MMTTAYDLYTRYTLEELVEMNTEIMATSERITDSIHLYPPKVRAKLDAIGWAIYYHMNAKEATKKAGME